MRFPHSAIRRWPVCGAWINLLTQAQLLVILASARHGLKRIVANHNLHSLYLSQADPGMRTYYGLADSVHADGRPVLLLARLLGAPARHFHLQTSIDFIMPLFERLRAHGRRAYIIGGKPPVIDGFLSLVRERFPGLMVAGDHGYLPDSGPDLDAAIARLDAFSPDILLLGMGMPHQERWYLRHQHRLPACTVMNLGAFMDYWVGEKAMAPRWLGRIGLEWAWRLAHEPRRLAHRYLIEPFGLIRPSLEAGRRVLLPDLRRRPGQEAAAAAVSRCPTPQES